MDYDTFTGAVLVGYGAYLVIALVLYVLLIVAQWKIFTKAGEKGWKSLIPGYNLYIQFKLTWNTTYFWIWLVVLVVGAVFQNMDSSFGQTLYTIFNFAQGVILVIDQYKLSKAFGHGVGYTFGLILLPNIFTMILGFGKDQYQGPQA